MRTAILALVSIISLGCADKPSYPNNNQHFVGTNTLSPVAPPQQSTENIKSNAELFAELRAIQAQEKLRPQKPATAPSIYQSSEPSREEGDILISDDSLTSLYDDNEVSSDQAFLGKRLTIEGHVERVGKNFEGKPYILLAGDEKSFTRVQCFFVNPNEVAQYSKYDKVEIKGVCGGLRMNVIVTDCSSTLIKAYDRRYRQ